MFWGFGVLGFWGHPAVVFRGLAVSQLLFGSLADHLGRRPPLLYGLALSVVGSVGCALSGGVASLTVWRVVQALGVGSASVIPRAVIRDRFDVAHTARALSLLGLITCSARSWPRRWEAPSC